MPYFPPYSEESLQYYLWGLRKGFLQPDYEVPDIEIPEEQTEPYYQGIRDGENYGANGYPVDQVCYDLSLPHSLLGSISHQTDILLEAGGVAHTLAAGKILAAGFEGGLLFLMVSIAATVHYQLPTQVLDPSQARELANFLQGLTEPLSMELYFGGGVDYDIEGCQLQMTQIYKSADWARSELQGIGRPAGMLLSIRTDMSGGLRVMEEYGEIRD
jgi:hypothetical protein